MYYSAISQFGKFSLLLEHNVNYRNDIWGNKLL